jgi:chromosome segregation ATPase
LDQKGSTGDSLHFSARLAHHGDVQDDGQAASPRRNRESGIAGGDHRSARRDLEEAQGQLTTLATDLYNRLNELSARQVEVQEEQAKLREHNLRNELTDAADALDDAENRAAAAEARFKALQDELVALPRRVRPPRSNMHK